MRLACSLAVLVVQSALAQPAFETADVRVSAPGTLERGGFLPNGRFEIRGATMLKLIALAYGVGKDEVLGGPAWMAGSRFDIAAKAAAKRPPDATPVAMLRTLLIQRFGLAAREEQQEMPVYLLKVVRATPKLQVSVNPQSPICPRADGDPRLNHRECQDYTMADLAKLLPQIAHNYADHPVVDATGLKEAYNFSLDWMEKSTYLAAKSDPSGIPPISLSDALAKLGLTLAPATRPTRVILIDNVNPPTVDSDTPVEFDAADVHPSKSVVPGQGLTALPGGEVEIEGYTLRELLAMAFEVDSSRIAGGPKWLDTDRFDVAAKSHDVMSPHALAGMLKTLLTQRFHLVSHADNQPLPVFALIAGKSPRLRTADPAERSECSLTLEERGRIYRCRHTTMAEFADRLPNVAQAYLTRPLVDLSGLKGAYDFELTWTPKGRQPGLLAPDSTIVEAATPTGNFTLFDAVDKQLGMKIDERKYPMPVIAIDRVEHLP